MRRFHFVTLILGILLLGLSISVSRGEDLSQKVLFKYLSPMPGAKMVSKETTLAFRLDDSTQDSLQTTMADAFTISVSGSMSGNHNGHFIVADDNQTGLFIPDQPFVNSEIVDVKIEVATAETADIFQYNFYISAGQPDVPKKVYNEEVDLISVPANHPNLDPLPQYRTVPYDFPNLDVFSTNGTGNGYIFLSHFNYSDVSNGKAYLLILDENGEPVYYNRLAPLLAALDFKKQPNGLLTYFDAAQAKFIAMDNRYQIVGSYQTGNGYQTDLHDLQILNNNHALLLSYDYQLVDMSVIVPGGNPAAVVVGCIVQEVDGQGNVVFQWRSWDHIPVTDSNQDLTADFIRYIHCNSVEQDNDGNLLISSRHLDEVTKIDRQTGNIIWRLGGKQNMFIFTNDPGFYYQHDARRLPDGRLSLYDNRTNQAPQYSRAVEYVIDEQFSTVTRVFEYRANPDIFGGAMGNYQRLPGGNVLVGWGWSSFPILTEAKADGTKVFELNAEDRFGTYRAFRFPWQGYPTWPPRLIGYAEGKDVHLYFSYNGATEISSYYVYGDQDLEPSTLLAVVPRDGFETAINFQAPGEGLYYFRVMPVLEDGTLTQYSNTHPIFVGGQPVFIPTMLSN